MYDPHLEKLIEIALEDGVLTDKERSVLFKKAQSLGIDSDEFEMVLLSRLKARLGSQQPENKPEKFGTILKCPSCGSPVPAFSTKCKDCEHEFRNISANKSLSNLATKLENIEINIREQIIKNEWGNNDEIKKEIIMNYPIPNTKSDLVEIGVFISSKFIINTPDDLSIENRNKFTSYSERWNNVWISKYKQIMLQAKVLCKDDPTTYSSLLSLVDNLEVNAPVKNKNWFNTAWVVLRSMVFIFIGIILLPGGILNLPFGIFLILLGCFLIYLGFKDSSSLFTKKNEK